MNARDLTPTLAQWLQGTDIATLELRGPGTHITLARAGGAVVEAPPAQAAPASLPAHTHTVRAGSVGHCLLTLPGRDKPFVRVGQAVRAGEPLAVLRIGLVLLPVCAPRTGQVLRIAVSDGAVVGYGQPLFELA